MASLLNGFIQLAREQESWNISAREKDRDVNYEPEFSV